MLWAEKIFYQIANGRHTWKDSGDAEAGTGSSRLLGLYFRSQGEGYTQLRSLGKAGNTVVVIEHDIQVIIASD